MNTPTLEEHYGVDVWTNKPIDNIRKEECLCLHCSKQPTCPIAKQLYEICKANDIAMCITRCKSWSPQGDAI